MQQSCNDTSGIDPQLKDDITVLVQDNFKELSLETIEFLENKFYWGNDKVDVLLHFPEIPKDKEETILDKIVEKSYVVRLALVGLERKYKEERPFLLDFSFAEDDGRAA